MKPKITIGILTYNQQDFIQSCLVSILSLKYENLEIIISDDCSKDNTVDIIKNFVKNNQTNHEIILNFNQVNLGLAGNFNRTFEELASGDYFIILGGDDIIAEDYLDRCLKHLNNTDLMMIDFNAVTINDKGEQLGIASKIDFQSKIYSLKDYLNFAEISTFAPGRLFKKELVKNFPPINKDCPTEDSVLVLRALLMGKILRLNQKVIFYRKHTHNISSFENLKRISNSKIVAQYLSDVLHMYNKKLMNDEIFPQLIRRIDTALLSRQITFSDISNVRKRIMLKISSSWYKYFRKVE